MTIFIDFLSLQLVFCIQRLRGQKYMHKWAFIEGYCYQNLNYVATCLSGHIKSAKIGEQVGQVSLFLYLEQKLHETFSGYFAEL